MCSWGLSSQEVFRCSRYSQPIMTLVLLPVVWAAQVPPSLLWRPELDAQLGNLINHPAFHVAAVLLIAPGMAWAVGDNDMVTARHWPGHLLLFCAWSVPVSDPLALTPLPKKCHQLLNGLPSESLFCNQLWKNTGCDSDLGLLIFSSEPYQALFIVRASQMRVWSLLCVARTHRLPRC